ncbi:hypothetical protein CH296_11265 [Rhodococcus sp. 14-2496-1d]|uniref:hypothetical protein n=1 Tax=Rhodococcus sp. 14-2496-1d TaxID=2023146 RepID=UPI000B9BE729|nr:hypothetical protein [Rhodococcus sp. 14-2496-1d]OZF33207.1 hypothetical protein CH296_11265 [Rhodococcus sp. 14-2496-1d]
MDEKTVSRLLTILITVVTLVWATTVLVVLFVPDAHVPPEVNVIMLALVGFLTGSYVKAKKPEDKMKDGESDVDQ